jgi:hypothetical protein
MVVLDGNFALDCGPGMDYPYIRIFQCMLERKDAVKNEVLDRITFVLAYHTVPPRHCKMRDKPCNICPNVQQCSESCLPVYTVMHCFVLCGDGVAHTESWDEFTWEMAN